jgi:hypothetical protein
MTIGRVLAVCLMGTHVIACTSSSTGNAGIEQLTSGTSQSTPNIGTGDKPDVSQPPAPDTGPIVDTAPEPEDIASQDASTLDAEIATDTTGPTDSGASDTGTLEDTEGSGSETEDAIAPPEDTSPIDEDTGLSEDTGPEPGCVPGSATCDGQEVVVCGPTGDSWFVVATCSEDKPCIDGTCCSPQCEGKSCGDDGCGGLCGTCQGGWTCDDSGQCETAPECSGDEPCNDGNPCTEDDTCTDGLCVGQPVDCGDDDPCTQTGCDETGCYAKPTDCDDDDPCTDDGCNSQGCFHNPATCDDGVLCTDDSCGAAGCEYTVQAGSCLIDDMCVTAGTIPDDNTCLICDPGESNTTWSPRGPVTCDDGSVCTVGDVCDGDTCVSGADISCESDNPCESATCDPLEGCVTTPVADGGTCTMPCFGEATCQAGVCEAVPESAVVCPASAEPCVASIGCDPATGACTVEAYVPKGAPCDSDENICSIDACDGDGACTATGELESCEDESAGNPCWDYSCQPTTGCVQTDFNEGGACDDGNACTMDDTCFVGQMGIETCIGSPLLIDDDNPCTDDFCDDGVVNHTPIDGMPCDPESPCSDLGLCEGGVCQADSVCECAEDGDCPETEVCVDFACTGTYCGNGICDPGDDADCPNDCSSCIQAIWCNGECGDPVFGKPLCAKDCCGDGFCAATETAECCPADCTPETVCDEAQVVDTVPAEITGDNSGSNALFTTLASTCGDTVFPGLDLFDFGEGREDVIQFIAPFSGTFGFQLTASWSSQMWFFTDCEDAGATCTESADMDIGQTTALAGLELSAGEAIFVVVDSGSLYFGDGPYTLLIDGLCSPGCGGKECGDDGCGGSCGECGEDDTCQDGECEGPPVSCADALFFSQYIEGGNAHKALEIYNHTDALVDLSTYVLWRLYGGGSWDDDKDVQELSGALAPGDVFVVCKSDAHASIAAVCDLVVGDGFVNYSGDDGIALVRDGVIVDQIGEEGTDVDAGWDVAGVNDATKDHTLVRVAWVTSGSTNWAESAADQWIVLSKDDTTGIGDHEVDILCPCTAACDGAVCGDDGCGGSCGSCADDQVCQDGVCEAPTCVWGYEPLHFDPCAIEASTGPLLLTPGGTYTYNTDDGTLTGPNAVDPATEVLTTLDPEVRLMIVDRLEIPVDTTLKVVGAMPLVVVSLDDIDIQGTVDVSSTLSLLGAGANPATCGDSTGGIGTTSGKNAGGGGGGGALGGNGGDGASPGGSGGFGGDNGVSIGPPATIRGGCGGGSGAKSGGGDGGGGGGALYLSAQNSISVSGVLHAGGAGGEGGEGQFDSQAYRSGGGGGGSGGYLGLEAPTVTLGLNAVLAANGGGGGGGTDITHAGNGAHGAATDAPAAAGGQGHGNGGSGGIGAILAAPDGSVGIAGTNTRGAGGGGGGQGFIIVNSPVLVLP